MFSNIFTKSPAMIAVFVTANSGFVTWMFADAVKGCIFTMYLKSHDYEHYGTRTYKHLHRHWAFPHLHKKG